MTIYNINEFSFFGITISRTRKGVLEIDGIREEIQFTDYLQSYDSLDNLDNLEWGDMPTALRFTGYNLPGILLDKINFEFDSVRQYEKDKDALRKKNNNANAWFTGQWQKH